VFDPRGENHIHIGSLTPPLLRIEDEKKLRFSVQAQAGLRLLRMFKTYRKLHEKK
jgi:hypothetical protein